MFHATGMASQERSTELFKHFMNLIVQQPALRTVKVLIFHMLALNTALNAFVAIITTDMALFLKNIATLLVRVTVPPSAVAIGHYPYTQLGFQDHVNAIR
jgi:hypothetical protein